MLLSVLFLLKRPTTVGNLTHHLIGLELLRGRRCFQTPTPLFMALRSPLSNEEISTKIYKPLNTATDEIRLLNLHPSLATDSTIRCTLSHAALSPSPNLAMPVYEALSYVWGEPNLSASISLNDETFWITPNLESILQALRLTHRARVLWIDALCINQSDPQERGQQVAIMRKIYSSCQRDIAWLGHWPDNDRKSENTPERALALKRLYEQSMQQGMELMRLITQNGPKTLQSLQNYDNSIPSLVMDNDSQKMLERLFYFPTFWQRVWIVQELSLAPHVHLMCGGTELSWDVLSTFFKDEPYIGPYHMAVYSHSSVFTDFMKLFISAKLVEDQRQRSSSILSTQDRTGERDSTLLDVLARFRHKQSTDPRDKIYGLLGLVTQKHGIVVDYTKSLSMLYQEVTLSIIHLSGDLDIICQNPFESRNGPDALQRDRVPVQTPEDSIPSWAALFHMPRDLCFPILFAQRDIFKAGLKQCDTPCRLLGPRREALALRGSILGYIGPIRQVDPHLVGDADIIRSYLGKDILDDTSIHQYVPIIGGKPLSLQEPETAVRAYWRTLVKDCTAPPRMHRLLKPDIEALDSINRDHLRRGLEVKTFGITFDKGISKSAFAYDPGEDFDFTQVDDSKSLVLVDLPLRFWRHKDFMFTITDNGLFLLTRPHVQKGDIVVVLDGGKVPMVLRKAGPGYRNKGIGEVYHIVCSTYVHGFMDGEAEIGVIDGWLKKEDFLII
ncbi:heterokaryon incompatibility 6 OR allele [Fusarium mundagurra]|uniref:Heterokaryon incompatibility 6 OR allele n=1 Tax=Fusarium mundagurra TaxID=1567541 RepID=A0A8H5YD49_9HYPO|nr:heterokaryon incompatibility 6 OR allele [Fusarium mundagurra]